MKQAVKAREAKAAPANGQREHGSSMTTAFQRVRELIVHGRLAPGTRIVEAELAERLGMSRTPVRGALQWLQREGYVVEQRQTANARMLVAPLTGEDANELYLIIGRIEGLAGRRVAAMPPAERKRIATLLRRYNRGLAEIGEGRGPQGDIFELDREFHRVVIHHGAGPRLAALHRTVEPQAERYWRLYASSVLKDLHLSVAEHERIAQAVERGKTDELETSLQMNWSKGAERLGRVIEVFGERGSW